MSSSNSEELQKIFTALDKIESDIEFLIQQERILSLGHPLYSLSIISCILISLAIEYMARLIYYDKEVWERYKLFFQDYFNDSRYLENHHIFYRMIRCGLVHCLAVRVDKSKKDIQKLDEELEKQGKEKIIGLGLGIYPDHESHFYVYKQKDGGKMFIISLFQFWHDFKKAKAKFYQTLVQNQSIQNIAVENNKLVPILEYSWARYGHKIDGSIKMQFKDKKWQDI